MRVILLGQRIQPAKFIVSHQFTEEQNYFLREIFYTISTNGNLPNITFCVSLLKIHVCFILELSVFILYNMPYIQYIKKIKSNSFPYFQLIC